MASIVNSVCEIIQLMSKTKVERIQITYEIGDIIEEKCRRCYYNRSEKECFSISVCQNCPTGQELRQLGRYFDTQPIEHGGKRKDKPIGLTPERVRELNQQGIPDKDISIMYDRSPSYVGKMKKEWKQAGIWRGPTIMREINRCRQ
ncbi:MULTISPECIES: hypothetical protein [Bacillus]|uniref:hypothetical protein n=1 Tax=Bacillus TaxID=1386 RepID=UPI001F5B096D|nr:MULTISPECIES: hypothetical protein [Bacillus]WOA59589.1 hypothetical protein RVY74_11235 [Bacillus mycoides]